MDSLCSTTTITKDSPEGHQKNQKNRQLLLLSKLLHRHRQNRQKQQILNASRRSLQKLTSLSTKSLARKLLRDRRILWLLECCRKEREFIADLKAGKFQQLLPLADVDKCQEESKEDSSKASSSLYDFEMDQLLYFSGHDSVSSLLADPLLKPIRYPADESDPQQRMLWQIYKLMDDEKEAGKAKQQQQQNPLPTGKNTEFCSCCKTPSLETSIDQLTLNSPSTSAVAAAGYSETAELRRENEALRARRRRQQRQALSVEEMSAKSKERRDSRKLKRLEKKKLEKEEEEEKVKAEEEEEVLLASSSKLTTSINQSAAKPLNL